MLLYLVTKQRRRHHGGRDGGFNFETIALIGLVLGAGWCFFAGPCRGILGDAMSKVTGAHVDLEGNDKVVAQTTAKGKISDAALQMATGKKSGYAYYY